MPQANEDPKKRKLYATHKENFGSGIPIPAIMKIFIIAIGRNIQQLTELNEANKIKIGATGGAQAIFKKITGYDHKRYREFEQEQKDNDGYLRDPEKTGRKARKLEVEYPTLVDYVTSLVEEAKFGGYLTKEKIKDKLHEEFNLSCSLKLLARTLRRLGFRWKKRKGQYISKKYSEETLQRLQAFCKWCYERTAWDPDDKLWYWQAGMQVAYSDETFLVSGEFTRQSWTAPGHDTADLPSYGRKRIAVPRKANLADSLCSNKLLVHPNYTSIIPLAAGFLGVVGMAFQVRTLMETVVSCVGSNARTLMESRARAERAGRKLFGPHRTKRTLLFDF